MGKMIISAVAIRRARSLANGYRSSIHPRITCFSFRKTRRYALQVIDYQPLSIAKHNIFTLSR